MEKKSEILENFKTAIGSTVKSLSNSENVEVSFGDQSHQSKNNSIKLLKLSKFIFHWWAKRDSNSHSIATIGF